MRGVRYPSVFNSPDAPVAQDNNAPQGWDAIYPAKQAKLRRSYRDAQAPEATYGWLVPPPAVVDGDSTSFGGDAFYPSITRNRKRQQPPGLTEAPGAFTTDNTRFGGEAFYPVATPHRKPQQPPGLAEAPGAFTTDNTRFGWEAWYPSSTRKRKVFQPIPPFEAPGAFTTDNTRFGGEVFAPATTRKLKRQQPDSLVLPPGQFTAAPNTTFGGEAFFPSRTRRLTPKQPPGLTEAPGAFTTVIPPVLFGWASITPETTTPHYGVQQPDGLTLVPGRFTTEPRALELIPRVPTHALTLDRCRRTIDITTTILNDLLRKGRIVRAADGSWDVSVTPTLAVSAGPGVTIDTTGGTLTVGVDTTVIRTIPMAGSDAVAFFPIATTDPSSSPISGAFMWVDSTGVVQMMTQTGFKTTVATLV